MALNASLNHHDSVSVASTADYSSILYTSMKLRSMFLPFCASRVPQLGRLEHMEQPLTGGTSRQQMVVPTMAVTDVMLVKTVSTAVR